MSTREGLLQKTPVRKNVHFFLVVFLRQPIFTAALPQRTLSTIVFYSNFPFLCDAAVIEIGKEDSTVSVRGRGMSGYAEVLGTFGSRYSWYPEYLFLRRQSKYG